MMLVISDRRILWMGKVMNKGSWQVGGQEKEVARSSFPECQECPRPKSLPFNLV